MSSYQNEREVGSDVSQEETPKETPGGVDPNFTTPRVDQGDDPEVVGDNGEIDPNDPDTVRTTTSTTTEVPTAAPAEAPAPAEEPAEEAPARRFGKSKD